MPAPQRSLSAPIAYASDLPPPVAAMRARILEACRTGEVEALRVPIDRNEVRPLFERGGRDPGADPIATLKRLSFDGAGRETLALLRAVLTQQCLRETRTDGRLAVAMFIWPAFAIVPPPDPTFEQRQTMLSCLRFADLGRVDETPPPFMRVGLGPDGVWHYFWNVVPSG